MSYANEVYYKAKEMFPEMTESELNDHVNEKVFDKVSSLTTDLVDITNGSSTALVAEGMLMGILSSHKTLQSEFFDALTKVVEQYANTNDVDGRNEWCKNLCARWNAVSFSQMDADCLKKVVK